MKGPLLAPCSAGFSLMGSKELYNIAKMTAVSLEIKGKLHDKILPLKH